MELIISLVIASAILFAVTTGFCFIFKSIEGHWPDWHFSLFLSWWWPFRDETAATLTAVALDVDEDTVDWSDDTSAFRRGIASKALNASIETGCFDGEITLRVAGNKVPLSLWDCWYLRRSYVRWRKRRDSVRRKASTKDAAEIFTKAFKAKYGKAA